MNDKEYKPTEFTISDDTIDVCKGVNDFYCTYSCDDIESVHQPRLFIRRSDLAGVLRLNFCTYVKVNIPEKFKSRISQSSTIEFFFSGDGSEMVNTFVPVSHVLKFPEIYELILSARNAGQNEEQETCSDEKNSADDASDELDKLLNDVDDEMSQDVDDYLDEDFPHITSREMLAQWLSDHSDFRAVESTHKNYSFFFVTDDVSKAFLVCCFDTQGTWLADEEVYNDEIPMYFSETTHVNSPVSAVFAVSDFLKNHTGLQIMPILLFGDAVSVINVEDMASVWSKSPVKLYGCNRIYNSGVIKNFGEQMEILYYGDEMISYTPEQITLLAEKFSLLDRENIDNVMKLSIRTSLLQDKISEPHTAEDIIKVWLQGNYTENCLVGRYWDSESKYFFNLVYNYSNVAILLEAKKDEHVSVAVEAVAAIRKKLHDSGATAALTPCIISENPDRSGVPLNVRCYDSDALFSLEALRFQREMGFDNYPSVSASEVNEIANIAKTKFIQDGLDLKESEFYTPDHHISTIVALTRLVMLKKEKKLFANYDTKTFAKSAWTLTYQRGNEKVFFIFKSFNGENLNKTITASFTAEQQKIKYGNTTIITVVLVNESVSKNFNGNYCFRDDIVYVGADNLSKALAEIVDLDD